MHLCNDLRLWNATKSWPRDNEQPEPPESVGNCVILRTVKRLNQHGFLLFLSKVIKQKLDSQSLQTLNEFRCLFPNLEVRLTVLLFALLEFVKVLKSDSLFCAFHVLLLLLLLAQPYKPMCTHFGQPQLGN